MTSPSSRPTPQAGSRFSKAARLRFRREFERVGRQGVRLFGRNIVVEALSVSDSRLKLGVTVTKKFGKAHTRNRFKRCVREAFRLSMPFLPKGLLINVRPKSKDFIPTTQVIKEELKALFYR